MPNVPPPLDPASVALLSAHLAVTAAMVGLIWFVQVVHYPLFRAVGQEGFVDYEHTHRVLTSYVVGPLMGVELLVATWLVVAPPAPLGRALPLVGLGLLAVIHTSTVLLQVPQHTALSDRYDPDRVQRLVRTNWVRTAGWTARVLVAVVMVMVAVAP